MSEHKPASPKACARIALIAYLSLLCACATPGIRLSDSERADLKNQPAISVLHYQTPLPTVQAGGRTAPPSAAAVRKHAGVDPALLIAQGFSRMLGKRDKLKNLQVETRYLNLPVADNARSFRTLYPHGLVLELWVDDWTFNPLPADSRTWLMTLGLQSRLSRIDDGQILWSTGRCAVGGHTAKNRDWRLAQAELTSGARLRKLLAMARDECARQLMRDLESRNGNGKASSRAPSGLALPG